jgi:hypothetical protein
MEVASVDAYSILAADLDRDAPHWAWRGPCLSRPTDVWKSATNGAWGTALCSMAWADMRALDDGCSPALNVCHQQQQQQQQQHAALDYAFPSNTCFTV